MKTQYCAKKLRALADPDRLRIIAFLRDGPKNVGDIATALKLAPVNVSHHLGVLRAADLLKTQRQGRFIYYRLPPTVYQPQPDPNVEYLTLGCCRLEIPKN